MIYKCPVCGCDKYQKELNVQRGISDFSDSENFDVYHVGLGEGNVDKYRWCRGRYDDVCFTIYNRETGKIIRYKTNIQLTLVML